MYKRMLLATDGSELAQHAAEHGIGLAKVIGASVVAVYASPPFAASTDLEFMVAPLLPDDIYMEGTRAAAARHLGAVQASAERAGVPCKIKHSRGLTPAEAVVALADLEKCDLVVVGSHGRGVLGQFSLGSVTTRVLATCSVPALVYREAPKARRARAVMYKRILICTDGSALATHAADHAVGLAKAIGARLLALYVTPPFQPPKGFEESPLMPAVRKYVAEVRAGARRHLGAVARLAERAGVHCETRHVGAMPPAQQIVDTAKRSRCDLIVMGSHGRGLFKRVLMGSVTSRVLETCAIPVLVVRPDRNVARVRAAAPARTSR